jgi:hypothetical protein
MAKPLAHAVSTNSGRATKRIYVRWLNRGSAVSRFAGERTNGITIEDMS